jgi:hypothetical protein
MSDIFDTVSQKLALFELEGNTVLHKNITDTLEETKQSSKEGRPQKDVVDDDAAAEMGGVSGVAGAIQSLPFTFENPHHACVKGGSIARPKRHNTEAPFGIVGRKESELLLIAIADADLMIASFIVQRDEE